MLKILFLVWVLSSFLYSKELFLEHTILKYFDKNNPYYSSAIAKEMIRKSEELFYEGAFDTQLNLKYDKKKYPVTEGTYQEANIIKPLAGGVDLHLSYRNAQGTQEYNNIKTGRDGEVLAGIRIPIISAITQLSKRDVNKQSSQLRTKIQHQESRNNLLGLYYNISALYYRLLLQKELVTTEEELLHKANKNKLFIEKEIKLGKLPQIAHLDIQNQILVREQRLLLAKNLLLNTKNLFVRYLGISVKDFNKKYSLPRLKRKDTTLASVDRALSIAISNKPELSKIDLEGEKISLDSDYNELEAYPKINVGLYGAYDPLFNEGYKVAVNFSFPLERNAYKGRKEALQKEKLLLNDNKRKIIFDMRANITNILQKIEAKQQSIILARKEIKIAKRLNEVEIKKYKEGLSNLMFLNQREITVLHAQQKLMNAYYELHLLYLDYNYALGIDKINI